MLWTHLVIHVHELALKGKNRDFFEQALLRNIERVIAAGRALRAHGRVVVPMRAAVSEEDLRRRVAHLFGASHATLAVCVSRRIDDISRRAVDLVRASGGKTFCVRTERADKNYPMTSMDVDRAVGEVVRTETGKRVSLEQPDVTATIELLPRAAFVSTIRLPGPGGLPVGTSGRFGVLLSGGIDSPVAAYEIMRRGGECAFVHFHSVPYTDRASIEKVREISELLSGYQGGGSLILVPFADLQKEIVIRASQALRVVLYRRFMMRAAERVLRGWAAQAIVTGESLGQVASQTIENIAAIQDAATLPVIRPLITRTKEEIIARARDIGTYGISIRPHEDCCSLFMPSQPSTHASVAEVRRAEAALDSEELVNHAARAVETVQL